MKRKNFYVFIVSVLMSFMFVGCSYALNDIDLGEGYHVPQGFSSILITSSDGTAIQNAVNYIQNGGTILLSGDFKLNTTINIKKNLSIKGSKNTVLDRSSASNKDRVIRCQGDINLENLTIKGGFSTNGGGIKLDGGTVNITNCKIVNNESLLGGGGIHSEAKTLVLTDCELSDNLSLMSGGGISAIDGNITITNCKITKNTAKYGNGGGVGVLGSVVTMNNCTIMANTAANNGGGIYIASKAALTAENCDISDNTANTDPNIYYDNNSTYTEK